MTPIVIVWIALGVIIGGAILGLAALGVAVLVADDVSNRTGAYGLGLGLILFSLMATGSLGLIAYVNAGGQLSGLGTLLGLSLAGAMFIFTILAIVAIIKDNWRRFRLRRQGVDPDER